MGVLYKHLDDVEIIKRLFHKNSKVEYNPDPCIYGEDDEGNSEQIGRSILIDDTYELVPVKKKQVQETLTGKYEVDTTGWDVWLYKVVHGVHYYPDGSGEPDDTEEISLGNCVSFDAAIKAIHADMIFFDLNCVMENAYYENAYIEEQQGECDE